MPSNIRKRPVVEKNEKAQGKVEKHSRKNKPSKGGNLSRNLKIIFLLIAVLIFIWFLFGLIAGEAPTKHSEPKGTNTEMHPLDNGVQNDLRAAQKLFEQGQLEHAKLAYEKILKSEPRSPSALFGLARTSDQFAEQRQDYGILDQAIRAYMTFIDLDINPPVPSDALFEVGTRLVNRLTFRGKRAEAVEYLKRFVKHFAGNAARLNILGMNYLLIGENEDARKVFLQVLHKDPTDGYALVHIGFIMKTHDNNAKGAIDFLEKGIATNAAGTQDGRFYFQLGDAYQRNNQTDKAHELYAKGVKLGLFKSLYQRSLYNVDRLMARPWWTEKQTGYTKHLKTLQDNWKIIRDEAIAQMDVSAGLFRPEDENLREKGNWQQYTLYAQGRENAAACKLVPQTCSLIAKIPDAAGCRRGQIKFSLMHPGTHVWPHCGPTNCRVRAHLGLRVPKGPKIRVGNVTREWKEGEFIIFDDSFEHEVWHDGDSFRLVLIVDFWHPELTPEEKKSLPAI